MAFTKAPTQDTHGVRRFPPSGDIFVVTNKDNEEQPLTCNYLDCFPLTEKQFSTNPRVTVQRREGWKKAVATGTVTTAGTLGKDMVIAPDSNSYTNVFFTKQSTYYMFNYGTKTVSSVTTSTTAAQAASAAGCDAIDSTNARRICWLDPANELKTFLQDGTSVTTTSLAAINAVGYKGLVFIDGYLFAVDGTGTKIYNSGAANALTTWATTDFIDAEMYGDPILQIAKHKNYLVAFGERSTEFFYNAGIEVGSPLARQESYARQIGLFRTSNAGRNIARIGDDLYFLGMKEGDSIGLFKLSNFQIEEVGNQYLGGLLNYIYAEPNVELLDGLQTIIVNNNPMIVINSFGTQAYSIVYFPQEDTWWMMRTGDPSLVDYPTSDLVFGRQFYTASEHIPMFIGQLSSVGSEVYYWLPDYEHTQELTSVIITPTIDMDNNRYKHWARLDIIGSFGVNTDISVKVYKGGTGYYDLGSPLVVTPTRTTTVYDATTNPIAYYNLGAFRRAGLYITLTGADHWIYEGLELEYNQGVS